MDFIIDRTNEDVMYAQSFIGAVWSKMTNAQKQEWLKGMNTPLESLKGFFNHTDMTRIKSNYNSLRNTYGYSGSAISTSYGVFTIPNRTTMSADFLKIKDMGTNYLPYFVNANFNDYRTITELSYDVNKIDYNFVNNYEHILKNLYDYNHDEMVDYNCEFSFNYNRYRLDGFLCGKDGHRFNWFVPEGFITTARKGTMEQGHFVVDSQHTSKQTMIYDAIESPNLYRQLLIYGGIQTETLVGSFGTGGNTVSVTTFDKVRLDSDMLKYSTPTTYTATEIQSDLIDVSSLTKMYCYNILLYGDNAIVTLYNENEDAFDEVDTRENTFIDLTNASYITFDTDVGTEITYITSDGSRISTLMITVGGTTYNYPTEKSEFDVSDVNSITVMYPAPTQNRFVFNVEKSIIGGKDISQLDTSEVKARFI